MRSPSLVALAVCSSLCGVLLPSATRADLRVFEANAPTAPAPAEPREGLGPLVVDAIEGSGAAPTPALPDPAPAPQPFLDDHRWLDLTGFLQPGFIARFDDPSDGVSIGNTDETFWLQRARLGARAQLFSWLRFRIEVEFTPTTSLQDGFVDITPHPFFNVRAGQFIVPFLRTFQFNEVNLGYIDRAIYTPVQFERGYLRYLAPRDMGLQLYGSFGDRSPDRTDPVFEYSLAVMNGRGPNLPINDDFVFLYAGRLNLHLFGVPRGADAESDIARNTTARTAIGVGGYSNCDDRGNWNRGLTFDAELRYEGVYASGAFVWLHNGPGGGTPVLTSQRCTGTPGPIPGVQAEFVSRAAHLQVQWALPRFWRDLGSPLDQMDLEILARFDWVDGNSPFDGNVLGAGGQSSPRLHRADRLLEPRQPADAVAPHLRAQLLPHGTTDPEAQPQLPAEPGRRGSRHRDGACPPGRQRRPLGPGHHRSLSPTVAHAIRRHDTIDPTTPHDRGRISDEAP
jgi:hypothetical protein